MTHLGAIAKGVAGLVIFAACFAAPLTRLRPKCVRQGGIIQAGRCFPPACKNSACDGCSRGEMRGAVQRCAGGRGAA